MSEKSKAITLVIILFFCTTIPLSLVFASDFLIVLNEICWMGSSEKTSDEWIELYNNTNEKISLENWILKIDDTEIKLKNTIDAQGYYLISRNKTTQANLIFSKALKNTGNKIILFNENKNIIDELDWSKGWPAGDNKTKQTMERKNSLLSGSIQSNWQTSANSGGTPKTKNSNGIPININSNRNEAASQAVPNQNIQILENVQNENNQFPKSSTSYQAILFAMFISFSSGAIIFFLKKSLSQKTY